LRRDRREKKRRARQRRNTTHSGWSDNAFYLCGCVANCLEPLTAQTSILDESQPQPDDTHDYLDDDHGNETREVIQEHSSAAPQPTNFMDGIDEVNETASGPLGSEGSEDLTGPSDSEQELELPQIGQDSYADHLPLRLQGLSIAEIAKSEWLAETFVIGECAEPKKRVCI